jgi:transcriptional regulator with XRE-family HTH domain
MTTFRSSAYEALVAVLKSQREARGLSQTDVARALPKWLGFDYTTVNKIEHKRRNVSFVEVREIAKVLDTNIAALDLQAEAVEHALNSSYRPARRAKRRKAGRKG